MADPISMVAIGSMAATAIGSGVSAYGSMQSGAAKSNMYQYQAQVARINKQIQEQNEAYARDEGEVAAQQAGMKYRDVRARTMAAQSHSGIDVNRGTGVNVRESEVKVGQQEQAIIRADAAKRAYGFDLEAMQAEHQGVAYEYAAKDSKSAGTLGAISSLVSGAASVGSKWMGYQQYFGTMGNKSSGAALYE